MALDDSQVRACAVEGMQLILMATTRRQVGAPERVCAVGPGGCPLRLAWLSSASSSCSLPPFFPGRAGGPACSATVRFGRMHSSAGQRTQRHRIRAAAGRAPLLAGHARVIGGLQAG